MSDEPLEFGPETIAVTSAKGELVVRAQKIRVEVFSGPETGKVVEFAGPEVRVGSSRGCDLVLSDATVSRHHLTLRADRNGIRVTDAGSTNGTSVDGIRVLDAYARPDSIIAVGNVTLRLRLLSDLVEIPISRREQLGALRGCSLAMRRVFTLLERVAATDATVLIEGETGTGKELAAEAVHEESRRSSGPFVVFDCSSVAPSLIESELFGHLRGSFTGAVGDRVGAFEAAHGGTLFLDEIGELPLDLQPRLLRALESREVRRIGANTPRKVDVRVVAATNRSLAAEVERGAFREDLYYRLAVVQVVLPPLRERPEDIPLLVEHFTREIARRGAGGQGGSLSPRLVESFQARSWPGNVRELRNAVERSLSLDLRDGPAAAAAPPPAQLLDQLVDISVPLMQGRERVIAAFETSYLRRALEATGGNVSRAAELAGVNRKFIQRAVKRYQLRGGDDDDLP